MNIKLFAKPIGCLIIWAALAQTPALADANYDQGLRLFQAKNYAQAAAAFEKSIENAPWESSSYYYCALSYHYGKNFKKAAEKYGAVIEKFPGTQAATQALTAIKVVDPNFLKSKEAQKAIEKTEAAAAKSGGATASTGGGKKDMGTVEGEAQTRVYFNKQGNDMIADIRVGGRGIRASVNPNSAETGFTRSQLQALGIQVPAGTKEVRTEVQLGAVVRKNFPVTVDDSIGTEPQIGQSFLDAFLYQVDEKANCISLTRKGGTGAGATASGPGVQFTKDGKDIVVNVEVNGRNAQMVFDPNGEGMIMPPRVAKSVGLKVDEAEEQTKSPAEGPQRGEPGWVPPDERPQTGPKYLTVNRVRFGPADKQSVNVQISEKESKYGKVGADICSGYKFDIDYQANVIRFTRK